MSSSKSKPKETKPQPGATAATVFGQKPAKLTVKVLRSILTSYGHKLKAHELRRDLLERVTRLENTVSNQDAETISLLLADKFEVTHGAILAGREYFEPSDDDDNYEDDYENGDDENGDHVEEGHHDEDGGRHAQPWRPSGPRQEHLLQGSDFPGKGKEVMRAPPYMAEEKGDESKDPFCNICYTKKLPQAFRDGLLHPNCAGKQMSMCEACIKRSINTQLSSVQWDKLYCPIDRVPLSADVVRQHLEPAVVPKYNKFMELQLIRYEPNSRWCCNPSCQSGQIHDGGALEPEMTCKDRLSLTCFTHERPWHEGQTCQEFDEQLDVGQKQQIAASEKKMKQISVPCPKCSRPITKLGGCVAVTCICGHSFDWVTAMGSRSDGARRH